MAVISETMLSKAFVRKGPIDNNWALVQIMAWHRQAIIWTNADPIQWRIYAALWGDQSITKHSDTLQLIITLNIFASLFVTEKLNILTEIMLIFVHKDPISSTVEMD